MVDDRGLPPAVNRNQLPQGEKFIKRVAVGSAQPNWNKRDTAIANRVPEILHPSREKNLESGLARRLRQDAPMRPEVPVFRDQKQ